MIIKQDGSSDVGVWGRDFTMSPDIKAVRQNLVLIVDNGQLNPEMREDDTTAFGATLGNNVFVWRSGVGVTADGALVYAGGPAMSIIALARTLQAAGAVRAMEMDINTDWVSAFTYQPNTTVAGNPIEGVKLLERHDPRRQPVPRAQRELPRLLRLHRRRQGRRPHHHHDDHHDQTQEVARPSPFWRRNRRACHGVSGAETESGAQRLECFAAVAPECGSGERDRLPIGCAGVGSDVRCRGRSPACRCGARSCRTRWRCDAPDRRRRHGRRTGRCAGSRTGTPASGRPFRRSSCFSFVSFALSGTPASGSRPRTTLAEHADPVAPSLPLPTHELFELRDRRQLAVQRAVDGHLHGRRADHGSQSEQGLLDRCRRDAVDELRCRRRPGASSRGRRVRPPWRASTGGT